MAATHADARPQKRILSAARVKMGETFGNVEGEKTEWTLWAVGRREGDGENQENKYTN